MKVMILCGGRGIRLNEETAFKPKPMVTVGNRPIVWHIMKLYSHYGFHDFILCLGYRGEMIRQYFTDPANRDPQWTVQCVDTGESAETGTRIARAASFLGDDEQFMLTYGDGVADIDIKKLVDFHNEHNKALTVSAIKPPSPFGVLEIDGHMVTSFAEKQRSKDWTSGGFMVCNRSVLDLVSDDEKCIFEQGPVQELSRRGELAAYKHEDFWHCVDTLKHLEGLNAFHSRGERPWMVWEQS